MERIGRRLGMLSVGVAVLGLVAGTRPAAAQSKEAKGTVTAVSSGSLTVQAGQQSLTFIVDQDTRVESRAAARQTRQAKETTGRGLEITEFVKTGTVVLVRYSESDGKNHALSVRRIASAGSAGGSTSAEAQKIAAGTVKAVSASALTLERNGRQQTFAVDATTRVLGRGAGTATKAAGGRIPVTDLIHNGDAVTVVYVDAAGVMHASEIRVRIKNP